MSKRLQKGSQYEQFDLDGDGVVTDKELAQSEHMIRLENSDKMQDQQRMLCWVSSISSIILIVLVMSPVIPDTRVEMVTFNVCYSKLRYSCYVYGYNSFYKVERKW